MRKSFLIPEFADDVFRLDVEYKDDDKMYFFSIQNPAGQVVRSFTEEKASADYIPIAGIRVLYNTKNDCVFFAKTDSDAQKPFVLHRAADGRTYYSLDTDKIKNWYVIIEDSPEEVFEMRRLKINRPVTQEDVANIKNLPDEHWINALREFRQPPKISY